MNKNRYLFLAFTLFYLTCEIIYNVSLVEFLTSKNTEITVYNYLENFGKAISSVGFTIIFIKFIKNYKAKVVSALFIIPLFFSLETYAFNSMLNSISNEKKVSLYYSGLFRNAVINNTIPELNHGKMSPYNKVLFANIIFARNSINMKLAVDEVFENKKIDSNELYLNYEKMSNSIVPLYELYALESRKIEDYKGKLGEEVVKRFTARSGGITPGLSKEEFYKAVSDKSSSMRKFNESVLIAKNEKLGIKGLIGKDLPLGMDRVAFEAFIHDQVEQVANAYKITPETVSKLPYSDELIASVVIPPIAIFLSYLSIMINTFILLVTFRDKLKKIPAILFVVIITINMSIPRINLYNLDGLVNTALHAEERLFTNFIYVSQFMHSIFINDKNPNILDIVVVKKPEAINFDDLKKSIDSMKNEEINTMPQIDERIKVDVDRLNIDKSYFGEIKQRKNVYVEQ